MFSYIQRLTAYTKYRGSKFLKIQPAPLRDFATETFIHEPAQEGYFPPPVTLEGQIDRATGNWWVPLKDVIESTTTTKQLHNATVIYKLENVIVDNGYLFKGSRAEYISTLGMPRFHHIKTKNEGVLCSSASGSIYFGIWLILDNMLEGISSELGQESIKVRPHKNYVHLPDINKLLNLSDNYVTKPTRINTLCIPDDLGFNINRVNRLNHLRKLFVNSSQQITRGRKLIYLLRGMSADSRSLTNELEFIEYLKSCGFKIINTSQMNVDDIVDEVANSDIVIGIEGSQLGYGLLGLKEGGLMIALQPPYHFQSSWRPRCEAVGFRWGFLVGFQSEEGFEIPLDDLKRLLDLVL